MRRVVRIVRGTGGATLVEMTCVVSLLAVVSFMLMGFLDSSTKVTSRAANDVRAEQAGQLALRTITQDVRAATSISPCSSTPYSRCLTFDIPRSASSGTSCPQNRITYELSGTSVLRTKLDFPAGCGTPTTAMTALPIITNIENGTTVPLFTYYASDQAVIDPVSGASSIPDAATIVVRLRVSFDPAANVNLDLSSTAALRNNRATS